MLNEVASTNNVTRAPGGQLIFFARELGDASESKAFVQFPLSRTNNKVRREEPPDASDECHAKETKVIPIKQKKKFPPHHNVTTEIPWKGVANWSVKK